MKRIFTSLTLCLVCLLNLSCFAKDDVTVDRPMIWVKDSDKQAILSKIDQVPWAESLFQQYKARSTATLRTTIEARDAYLRSLPALPADDHNPQPRFASIFEDASEQPRKIRNEIMEALQSAIDCGVLYYLTDDVQFAICAADTLSFFVEHISATPIVGDHMNRGWIYPTDHLKEARIYNAQVPIIYDFVYDYIANGGQVYDIYSKSLKPFDIDKAQRVFKRYAQFAIESGMTDTNWPVLESSSLVHNILAIDSEEQRQALLPHYLTIEGKHQDPLSKVASEFKHQGEIWPESLQYSNGVASYTAYLITLLDKVYPSLGLGKKYPNVLHAIASGKFIAFPNGEAPSFGDGPRRSGANHLLYEVVLTNAKQNNNKALIEKYSSLIAKEVATGDYVRSELSDHSYRAHPYFTPLRLLWGNDVQAESTQPTKFDRTNTLSFAGMYLQRNLNVDDDNKDNEQAIALHGLMAVVMGAHYVHGHAGGMNIELYGKGHVLGIDPGKYKYTTDLHENYFRLFAAHNTVISNGASASKGGWVNLGVETVSLVHMEPLPNKPAVSTEYSFSTTQFQDKHNLVAPATHQRTLAVIRTSDSTGYYVDIARARSTHDEQFHDYVYHNIGEELSLVKGNKSLELKPTPERFMDSAKLPWEKNETFRHPGWHFFEKVQSSNPATGVVLGTFSAKALGDSGVNMNAWYAATEPMTFSSVMAPIPNNASPPYDKMPTPTVVIRKQGGAWDTPFAAVYEPYEGSPKHASVKSVVPLCQKGAFCGLDIKSVIDGKEVQHLVIVLEGMQHYKNASLGLEFEGHFAIVKMPETPAKPSLYIGHGSRLKIGDTELVLPKNMTSGTMNTP